ALPAGAIPPTILLGSVALSLLVMPWLGPRLSFTDGISLRARLTFALGSAAALPMLVCVTVFAQHVETLDLEQDAALDQTEAQAIAYAFGQQLAAQLDGLSIAAAPELIQLPRGAQEIRLKGRTEVASIRLMATFDAQGRALARSDGGGLADIGET